MPQNLYEAHRQWANRPADERFADLDSLLLYTQERRSESTEDIRRLSSMKIDTTSDGGIIVNGSKSPAYFSNWAFGQLCRYLGAPAGYLRMLTHDLARDCLQYGLSSSGEECKLLIRDYSQHKGDHRERYASAFTSATYGRIWDSDVVESLMGAIDGSSWHVPKPKNGNKSRSSGLYASDHDVFAFFVNDENPVEVGNARLGKGFFCWNSETGASTFGLTTFLYNYVCDNHIVWGAEQVQGLKIIHKSQAPERFYRDAIPILNRFVENRAFDDSIKTMAGKAMLCRIGDNLEEVLNWFKDKPFTKSEIRNGWIVGTAEGEDVTSLWGIVQGLTASAKDLLFADRKVDLERRAGALLKII